MVGGKEGKQHFLDFWCTVASTQTSNNETEKKGSDANRQQRKQAKTLCQTRGTRKSKKESAKRVYKNQSGYNVNNIHYNYDLFFKENYLFGFVTYNVSLMLPYTRGREAFFVFSCAN